MHRQPLLILLKRHQPVDDEESESLDRLIQFVESTPQCFERGNVEGHLTAGGLLLNPGGDRVLLHRHRELGAWLQLGGHADGDPDLLRVALREAEEESGIEGIMPQSPEVFDVDVHWIPPRGARPGHFHYDVRFLLEAPHDRYRMSEESAAMGWFSAEEVSRLDTDRSVQRLVRKWQALSSPS